jgi:hypothetical protein
VELLRVIRGFCPDVIGDAGDDLKFSHSGGRRGRTLTRG